MELKEVIERRRTVRDFSDKEVPIPIIEYAITNAFKAPSYDHLRAWDFIVINSEKVKQQLVEAENIEAQTDIKSLEILFQEEDTIKKEMYLEAIPKQKKMILTAAAVIVVVFKPKTSVEKARRIYDLNCLSSVWACIENFLLSLAEHDVYGVTYIPKQIECIKSKFGIAAELEIAAIIPIGYKSEDAKIVRQKTIDIHQRIHFNKW